VSSRIRPSHAEIRLSNLIHNYRYLRDLVKNHNFVCPMLKANAYGHGDIECARALSQVGVHDFGVVLIEEGIRLREEGINGTILVFAGFDREAAGEVIKYNLTPVVSTLDDLKELAEQVPAGTSHRVHLKFNTGMNRLGFSEEEIPNLLRFFKESTKLQLAGICTHLFQAEDSFDPKGNTQIQLQKFEKISGNFESGAIVRHVLSSSAVCSQKFSGLGARPGIALYGARPALNKDIQLNLLPVMSIKSRVELTQKVKKHETVSYGGTWTAKQNSLIGVVPFGYADGYPRSASNKSFMIVKGRRVPVVGTVCMDYTMVDLTGVPYAEAGAEVVLLGQQDEESYFVEDLAAASGTISYEILTRISSRVPRIYSHEAV